MGPKRNRHEKAALRKVKAANRKQKQENQSDHDDVPAMKIQLEKLGLVLKEVEGDGNCLFRALSDQLHGTPEKHGQLRSQVVNYIRLHRDDFEPFHSDENVPFDQHLELLEQDGTYAGNDSLVAFARHYQVTICIHQLNEPLWQIHGKQNPEESSSGDLPELHISYHNGDHYNSVRRPGQLNTGAPPNIKLDVVGEVPDNSIWGQEGTGNRIFGSQISQQAIKGQKKMSAKARKKYEKRQQNNDTSQAMPKVEALSL